MQRSETSAKARCVTEDEQNEAKTNEVELRTRLKLNPERHVEGRDAAARRATHQRSVWRKNMTRLRSAKKADIGQ